MKRRNIWTFLALVTTFATGVLAAQWWRRSALEREGKEFCKRAIVLLEQYREEHGRYPEEFIGPDRLWLPESIELHYDPRWLSSTEEPWFSIYFYFEPVWPFDNPLYTQVRYLYSSDKREWAALGYVGPG